MSPAGMQAIVSRVRGAVETLTVHRLRIGVGTLDLPAQLDHLFLLISDVAVICFNGASVHDTTVLSPAAM